MSSSAAVSPARASSVTFKSALSVVNSPFVSASDFWKLEDPVRTSAVLQDALSDNILNGTPRMDTMEEVSEQYARSGSCCTGPVAKSFERVSLPVVWAWATHFYFPMKIVAGSMRVLRAPAAGSGRRMCGGDAPNHDGQSPRVEVELLSLTHCAARRTD